MRKPGPDGGHTLEMNTLGAFTAAADNGAFGQLLLFVSLDIGLQGGRSLLDLAGRRVSPHTRDVQTSGPGSIGEGSDEWMGMVDRCRSQ